MGHDDNSTLNRKVLGLLVSSIIITLPNYIWPSLGYTSLPGIALESALVVLSFIVGLTSVTGLIQFRVGVLRRVLIFSILSSVDLLMLPIQNYSSMPALYFTAWALILIFSALFPFDRFIGRRMSVNTGLFAYAVIAAVSGVAIAIALIAYGLQPTDEAAISKYSAHLFLSGVNPYGLSSLSKAYSLYGLPLSLITPTLTDGYVQTLSYPALSFLILIPSVMLKITPTYIFIPLYVIFPLLFLRTYNKSKIGSYGLVAVLAVLLNLQYFFMAAYGDNDIFWVLMVTLSLISFKQPMKSGFFMGLALAFKQFPLLIIPFFLYFEYKEMGLRGCLRNISALIGTFLLVNGYFLITAPAGFIKSVLSVESQQLMGVGFGPSQVSFVNLMPLGSMFFTFLLISAFLLLLSAYIVFYGRMRYGLFMLPALILLFNYRLLVQYIMFWPLISLLIIPLTHKSAGSEADRKPKNNRSVVTLNKSKALPYAISITVAVILIAAGISLSPHLSQKNSFYISQVKVIGNSSSSSVSEIEVNVTVINPDVNSSDVFFRFVSHGELGNVNGYLWEPVHNTSIYYLKYSEFMIRPDTNADMLQPGLNYRLIAYSGKLIGSTDVYIE